MHLHNTDFLQVEPKIGRLVGHRFAKPQPAEKSLSRRLTSLRGDKLSSDGQLDGQSCYSALHSEAPIWSCCNGFRSAVLAPGLQPRRGRWAGRAACVLLSSRSSTTSAQP